MDARLDVIDGIEAELSGYDVTDVGPIVDGRRSVEELRVVEVNKLYSFAAYVTLERLRWHKELHTGSALKNKHESSKFT